ncbi:MAG: chromosome partitioning protein ParB, partial [Microcystis sp. LE19-196.1B]|nr:chromosome partitioning protein ParB [Microcystis sp. LE19-196.1B]
MCYSEDTMEIKNIPLSQIRRPLPRQTDPEKVNQLMQSIAEEGLR